MHYYYWPVNDGSYWGEYGCLESPFGLFRVLWRIVLPWLQYRGLVWLDWHREPLDRRGGCTAHSYLFGTGISPYRITFHDNRVHGVRLAILLLASALRT